MAAVDLDVVGIVYSTACLRRGSTPIIDIFRFTWQVGVFYGIYQAYVAWVLPRIKGLSRGIGCPMLNSNNVNSDASVAWMKALEPDFLMSFHFNQKMLESVIEIPRRAALNFHPSYLPAWRGVDPVLFALQKSGATLGGSIHRVTAVIDAGDVLLREKLGCEHVAGLIKTNEALFMLGGRMAAEVIADFEMFDAQRVQQAQLESDLDLDAGRYDGWFAVGQLGMTRLWKALWAKPRKVS